MVELALVLPLLLLLLFGIIEYGRGYSVKVQLTSSVREGARVLALGGAPADARAAVVAAGPALTPTLAGSDITTTPCPSNGADGVARVSVDYALPALTPLIPSGSHDVRATAVMRCGL